MSEKKEFLTHYMTYRTEMMSQGLKVDTKQDDHLSQFWNDSNNNYLIWLEMDGTKIGFSSILITDTYCGILEDLSIFRKFRNMSITKEVVDELKKFARYRGLRSLEIKTPPYMDEKKLMMMESGFYETPNGLRVDLPIVKPQ
jgi:acetyltransferase (GNAT) family protein